MYITIYQINEYLLQNIFIDATILRNMIISLHSLTILMNFYVKKPCGKSVKALSQGEVKKLHKSISKKNYIFIQQLIFKAVVRKLSVFQ